jgi:8-oxo-dGTP pyrophosphatase MutT (NUDIX family)
MSVRIEIARENLRRLLAADHAIDAADDHGFSDDGEKESAPILDSLAAGKILKPAAVLVLFIDHGESAQILFTQRTAHLTDHAGQISFPGGRVEETDRDTTATALREAAEETGIDINLVEPLGALPDYTTGTGYRITPVVAWSEPQAYRPDPTEVEECFEVPAQFLIDPSNQRIEQAMYKGRLRSYYAIPYRNRYIWGATAGMLVSLTRVLHSAAGLAMGEPLRHALDSGG